MSVSQKGAPLEIERITGSLGAVVSNVDLSGALSDLTIAKIREAFLEHHVLFFRNQSLSPVQQAAFGQRFGALEDYPFVRPLAAHSKIIPVIKEADERLNFGGGWHTDLIYRPSPPLGTMLYAVQVPARGGDTLFADGVRAYQAVSSRMQQLMESLSVVYSVKHVTRPTSDSDNEDQRSRSMPTTTDLEVVESTPVHPLVRTHPETGKKGFYFSRGHTDRFEGMTPAESKPLLDWLYNHMTQPTFTARFQWQPGSLAFWDNRCVSHYALNDYHGERRHMHRLTIAGDRPV